ncbi:MAG TPA: SMP-30/gluconolactonase/LRE family protein [Pseudomonadales bacterium]
MSEKSVTTEILLDGLCFGEGPRWHQGALWLSDMHAHQVLRIRPDGTAETVCEVPAWPSGLGWLPNGDLLVVSMTDRRLLRWDGSALRPHADLSGLASFHCNDMVVDAAGRAYAGNFGFDLHGGAEPKPAELILVEPDGRARVVADGLQFPNGTVITPDGRTLIVAESWGRRLTAFDIGNDGSLRNRRVWAELPDGALPDGICLDADGGIWSASPTTSECVRQREGGEITHRVRVGQGAYACMLGGDDGRTLYILTAADSHPEACRQSRSGRVETITAPYPHAGLP